MANLSSVLGLLFSNGKEVALVEDAVNTKSLTTAWGVTDTTGVILDSFNCTLAVASATEWIVTFDQPMDNTNYSVTVSKTGTDLTTTPAIDTSKAISTTQFSIGRVSEVAGVSFVVHGGKN